MPAQPEPGAEKDEPSRQRTHEGAEEVGKHRPLRPPREADPLPNEQGSYDQEPADHGNLAHAMPPPRIVRRPAYPGPSARLGDMITLSAEAEYVLRTIEERGIRFVRLWFTDVLGFLKAFTITSQELEGAFTEGMGFDGSSIHGFSRLQEAAQG